MILVEETDGEMEKCWEREREEMRGKLEYSMFIECLLGIG